MLPKKSKPRNQIYIIPTLRGLMFLSVMGVMVLTAATYNNNLIFLQGFIVFAVFFVSMLQTHYNLKGVSLTFVSAADAFEGEFVEILFHLQQRRGRRRPRLQIRSRDRVWPSTEPTMDNLDADELSRPIRLKIRATRMGIHEVPNVILETHFPMGLFRAWMIVRSEGKMCIYPKPVGSRLLSPTPLGEGDSELGLRGSPEGDFGELKFYRPGESYHQIAWKHFAGTGDLYSKVHWGEEHKHYQIPWDSGAKVSDNYLRQMSAWVQQALDENATFQMETPRLSIAAGSGVNHARDCWRALAEFRNKEAA